MHESKKKPFSSPFFVPDWLIAWLLLSLLQTGDRRRRRRISPKIYFKKLIICLVYCSFFGKLGIGYIYILCMFLGEFRTLKATPDSFRAKIPESAFARLRLRRQCLPKGGRGRKKRGRKRRKKASSLFPPFSPELSHLGKARESVAANIISGGGWVGLECQHRIVFVFKASTVRIRYSLFSRCWETNVGCYISWNNNWLRQKTPRRRRQVFLLQNEAKKIKRNRHHAMIFSPSVFVLVSPIIHARFAGKRERLFIFPLLYGK